MKIVYLADDFPPHGLTSVAVLTFRLAKKLKDSGNEVFVISHVDKKDKQGWLEYHGLKVYFVYTQYPKILRAYLSLINPQTIFTIKKILKEIKPEIIHFQNIHTYLSYYCLKLAKRYGQTVFLTVHDSMLFNYGKLNYFIDQNNLKVQTNFNYRVFWWQSLREARFGYNPFRNLIIKHYLKYVDKIFAVSNSLKKALADNGISNVTTIYNSINLSDYEVSVQKVNEFKNRYNLNGKKIIFFGGRLSRYKGGEQLISALALIVKPVPKAVLVIAAAKKGNWGTLERLINKLNLANHIIITGWLSSAEITAVFNAIDVCVTPSTCLDTFNLFNIEAMAAKKPVVGTCFGGTPEIIIDGQTGYIVNPYNIKDLAEKIIDLLKNPAKAKRFGEAGFKRVVDYFSLEKQAQETLDWYNKFI